MIFIRPIFIYCSFYWPYVSGSEGVVTHESVFVSLGCLYKPVDDLMKMLNAVGDFRLSDWGQIFLVSPTDLTLCLVSEQKEAQKFRGAL